MEILSSGSFVHGIGNSWNTTQCGKHSASGTWPNKGSGLRSNVGLFGNGIVEKSARRGFLDQEF